MNYFGCPKANLYNIRNSLRYVDSANQKQFAKELKKVYQAFTKEEAEIELDKLEEKWTTPIRNWSLTISW